MAPKVTRGKIWYGIRTKKQVMMKMELGEDLRIVLMPKTEKQINW